MFQWQKVIHRKIYKGDYYQIIIDMLVIFRELIL